MRKYKIVHIDDHARITEGIRNLITAAIPHCNYVRFSDATKAYRYVENHMKSRKKIDLFITDFSHAGPDGYKLSCKIRETERKFAATRTNILLLTCVERSIPQIRVGLKSKIFNQYLNLLLDSNRVLQYVRNSLQ